MKKLLSIAAVAALAAGISVSQALACGGYGYAPTYGYRYAPKHCGFAPQKVFVPRTGAVAPVAPVTNPAPIGGPAIGTPAPSGAPAPVGAPSPAPTPVVGNNGTAAPALAGPPAGSNQTFNPQLANPVGNPGRVGGGFGGIGNPGRVGGGNPAPVQGGNGTASPALVGSPTGGNNTSVINAVPPGGPQSGGLINRSGGLQGRIGGNLGGNIGNIRGNIGGGNIGGGNQSRSPAFVGSRGR
jgi:hypothetical protein